MSAKFRNIGRVNFKANAREKDPVKLTSKKIACLARTGKNNSEAVNKYKRKARMIINRIKRLAFKRHGQESVRLFAKTGLLTTELELALWARPRRDHANRRAFISIH